MKDTYTIRIAALSHWDKKVRRYRSLLSYTLDELRPEEAKELANLESEFATVFIDIIDQALDERNRE